MADNSSSGIQVPDRVVKRHAERLEKKKIAKLSTDSVPKQLDYIVESFQEKKLEIESLLEQCNTEKNRENLHELFKLIHDNVLLLASCVSSSSMVLRVYDLRKWQEIIQSLKDKAELLENKLLPKKKFGFKNRAGGILNSRDKLDNCSWPESDKKLNKLIQQSDGFRISDKRNETIRLSSDEINEQDVTLSNLSNCTIIVNGRPNTVHINDFCKTTLVIIHPVRTSVMIHNSNDSVFVLACQQLRVHNTSDVDFYLHISTNPIIEDSTKIRLAPFPFDYPEFHNELIQLGFDPDTNAWDSANDFNWLVANRHSPNWSLLPESERRTDWPKY